MPVTTWCVYVIDLDPRVWDERSTMRGANPHYDPETPKGCLYVGMTGLRPNETVAGARKRRFKEHKDGAFTSSRTVRLFGRYLRTKLQRNCAGMTENEATKKELAHAEWLRRRRGYAV